MIAKTISMRLSGFAGKGTKKRSAVAFLEIRERAPMQNLVAGDDLARRNVASQLEARVQGTEVLITLGQQGLEAVDHEIGFLKIVDPVARAHDALEIEGDAVGGAIL